MHDSLKRYLERFLKKMFGIYGKLLFRDAKKIRKRSIRLFRFYRGIWPAISRGLGAAGPFQLTITSFTRFTKGFAISHWPRDETARGKS